MKCYVDAPILAGVMLKTHSIWLSLHLSYALLPQWLACHVQCALSCFALILHNDLRAHSHRWLTGCMIGDQCMMDGDWCSPGKHVPVATLKCLITDAIHVCSYCYRHIKWVSMYTDNVPAHLIDSEALWLRSPEWMSPKAAKCSLRQTNKTWKFWLI